VSDHNTINLELNIKRSSRKYSNNWRLNNMLHHDLWVIKEISRISKCSWNLMKMKALLSVSMGHSRGSHKRKVYGHERIY
jgi:hypothetical protein